MPKFLMFKVKMGFPEYSSIVQMRKETNKTKNPTSFYDIIDTNPKKIVVTNECKVCMCFVCVCVKGR